jgi:hypothetical protein
MRLTFARYPDPDTYRLHDMNAKTTVLALALSAALSACAWSGAPTAGSAPPASVAAGPTDGANPDTPVPASGEPEAPAPDASAGPSTFSSAQADRGRDTFRAKCTECHYSGEFAEGRFRLRWAGRTAGSLYDTIQQYMPETDPGSLRPEEAVDLLAYILRMNGFEPGDGELAPDRMVLDRISLARIRGG